MPLFAQDTGRQFSGIQFQPLFEDHGFPMAVMGLLVVFLALILVSTFIVILPRLMDVLARVHPEKRERTTAAAATVDEDQLPEEIMVVIAAAVAVAIDQPHRIVRTRELTAEDLAWTLEGRRQHHSSHRLRDRR